MKLQTQQLATNWTPSAAIVCRKAFARQYQRRGGTECACVCARGRLCALMGITSVWRSVNASRCAIVIVVAGETHKWLCGAVYSSTFQSVPSVSEYLPESHVMLVPVSAYNCNCGQRGKQTAKRSDNSEHIRSFDDALTKLRKENGKKRKNSFLISNKTFFFIPYGSYTLR